MIKSTLLTCFIGLMIMFTSCKKGDTGAIGPEGPEGPVGLTGAKGVDGSVIYSGANAPAANVGKNGDYYFRTSNSIFYGPKTSEGWGNGVNLKGNTGASGSKILSGTAIPAINIGAVGDFYFKTNSYHFYGPKTASGWGTAINLKGATGTANVIYSGWQFATVFKDSVMDGTSVRIAHISAPKITPEIRNSGTVMVYLDYGGGAFPLPFTSRAAGRMSTIAYHLKHQEIIIYRMVYDGGALLSPGSFISYRYIIIPGGMVAKIKKKGIDLNDYDTVVKALDNHME